MVSPLSYEGLRFIRIDGWPSMWNIDNHLNINRGIEQQ